MIDKIFMYYGYTCPEKYAPHLRNGKHGEHKSFNKEGIVKMGYVSYNPLQVELTAGSPIIWIPNDSNILIGRFPLRYIKHGHDVSTQPIHIGFKIGEGILYHTSNEDMEDNTLKLLTWPKYKSAMDGLLGAVIRELKLPDRKFGCFMISCDR